MHNPDPLALPWGDRYPTGHGLRPGPLVAPAQHPLQPFHWKGTPARLGRKQESHYDFPDFRIYPIPIPRDLSQDFPVFPDRIPVGFYPWSRSYLGPAYARIAEASTSFPVPPEGPDSGKRVSPLCVSDPAQGGPVGCRPPHAPLVGSLHVWPWGSLHTPPRGLFHATPLGGCGVTVHDPSPAHAGGSCHP